MNSGCVFFSASVTIFGLYLYFKEAIRLIKFRGENQDEVDNRSYDLLQSFLYPLIAIGLISGAIAIFSDRWVGFCLFFSSVVLISASINGYGASLGQELKNKNNIPMIIVFLVEIIFPALMIQDLVN